MRLSRATLDELAGDDRGAARARADADAASSISARARSTARTRRPISTALLDARSALGHRRGVAAHARHGRRAGGAGRALHAGDPRRRAGDARDRRASPHSSGPTTRPRRARCSPIPRYALVTTTVTEKGYCLAGRRHARSRASRHRPRSGRDRRCRRSVIGWIVAGLAARRAAGVAPFVPMPCDNLASNGAKLHAALVAFARARDPALADWIAGEVRVPSTMVDSITPASDDALYRRCRRGARRRGSRRGPARSVRAMGDRGCRRPLGPDLAAVGATVTERRRRLRDAPSCASSTARIRRWPMLGLLRGHASVAEAMADAGARRRSSMR